MTVVMNHIYCVFCLFLVSEVLKNDTMFCPVGFAPFYIIDGFENELAKILKGIVQHVGNVLIPFLAVS